MRNIVYSEEINALQNKEKHYFAAANTGNGFISFFSEIFNPVGLKKIYILKGGPGVGKSTLMKKAARAAEKKGFSPVYLHCSSDPASLDGVLIPETGKAILDGTAPHVVDPRFAGAREIIVNLGEAWDIAALEKSDGQIIDLCERKSACFRTAYRLLAAAAEADSELSDMGARCLDRPKMRAAIGRLCARHFKKSDGGTVTRIVTEAASTDGNVRFFTPEKQAEHLYFVKDAKSVAPAFFAAFLEAALRAGASVRAGVRPLKPDEINLLSFPEASVCISLYDDDFCRALDKAERPYKIINLNRFFDNEIFGHFRGKYRFTEKCRDALYEAALDELHRAGLLHGELETIYGAATDYKTRARMGETVIESIIS